MSAAPPSAFPLLVRNELRLYLRSGQLNMLNVGFLVFGQLILHVLALAIALASLHAPDAARAPAGAADAAAVMLSAGLFAMLMLMSSRALAGAVQSLYTRGDLDLLLSSPVDRRAVIGVRMGTIALTVALEVALLVWPFANVFVLFGRFAWFKAYLLVPAMAMLATSLGLGVTLLSFRTIGPRRTRVAVQVLAAVVGMGMMLAFYLPNMLQQGRGPGTGFGNSFDALARQSGYGGLLAASAGWVTHGFLPTLAFLAGAVLLLVLTIGLTGERLVQALTAITGGGARRTRVAGKGVDTAKFSGAFRAVVVFKELKLIARDPFLLAQILQQSLMVLPMAFVLWRSYGTGLPLAWLSVIWLAAGLASPLAWLTIVAEDAPDLLASAPVSRAMLVRAKIEAALLPVLFICALPLLLLGTRPWYAVCLLLCSAAAALSAALLNMRNPTTSRRDSFKTRHKGSPANGLVEVLLMFFWVLLCLGLTWVGSLFGWR